jgi:hypothetical protein
MLGRVTISSLGDIVQPFQNSAQFIHGLKLYLLLDKEELKQHLLLKVKKV